MLWCLKLSLCLHDRHPTYVPVSIQGIGRRLEYLSPWHPHGRPMWGPIPGHCDLRGMTVDGRHLFLSFALCNSAFQQSKLIHLKKKKNSPASDVLWYQKKMNQDTCKMRNFNITISCHYELNSFWPFSSIPDDSR